MTISKKSSPTAPLLMTVVAAFCMTTLATAQTTPGKQQGGTNQQGGTTDPQRGTQEHRGSDQQRHIGGGGHQGDQRSSQQGWHWFDDNAGRDMDISEDRMKELRQMDDRYRKDYEAMGSTPWTHENYQALTDRRNAEAKRLLTPEQNERWTRTSMQGNSPMQNRGTQGTQGTQGNRGTQGTRP